MFRHSLLPLRAFQWPPIWVNDHQIQQFYWLGAKIWGAIFSLVSADENSPTANEIIRLQALYTLLKLRIRLHVKVKMKTPSLLLKGAWISYMGTHVPMFVPKPQLNQTRTNVCLSSTVGFLQENIPLTYFVLLADRSSALSLSVCFFRTFGFRSILVGFFSWPRGTHLTMLWHFSCPQRTKYGKETFLGFLHWIWRTYLSTVTLTKCWDWFKSNTFYPKEKTVATFVLKAGLIWRQRGIFTRLFSTQMWSSA